MLNKTINADKILKKLTTLLIDEKPGNPRYMPKYMRIRYRYDKLDPNIKNDLFIDAERLLKKYRTAIENK